MIFRVSFVCVCARACVYVYAIYNKYSAFRLCNVVMLSLTNDKYCAPLQIAIWLGYHLGERVYNLRRTTMNKAVQIILQHTRKRTHICECTYTRTCMAACMHTYTGTQARACLHAHLVFERVVLTFKPEIEYEISEFPVSSLVIFKLTSGRVSTSWSLARYVKPSISRSLPR